VRIAQRYPESLRLTLPQLAMVAWLVSLSFFFGALILAFGLSMDREREWQHFVVPNILWVGTAALVLSSGFLEWARHALRRAFVHAYRRYLAATLAMAAFFLCVQCVSAADLLRQGVTAAGNPHGSSFYVFMGLHGVHLIAGMIWLSALGAKSGKLFDSSENDLRHYRRAAGAAAMFWHFMGALWLVMYFFLRRWSGA
jgi:cytochrome c oxidase subunit 3